MSILRSGSLTFGEPDRARFACLGLATAAGREGGTYPAVLAGADEAAVALFLAGRIGFLDIAVLVERALEAHRGPAQPSLDDLLAAHVWAEEQVRTWSRI